MTQENNITLSPDQQRAMTEMDNWWHLPKEERLKRQIFYLTGYAGTGKTTLISIFRQNHIKQSNVIYAAYTGKAALQMSRSGCPGARTIHSLIYILKDDSGKDLEWGLNPDSDLLYSDLLILDECSMVSEDIGGDLLSYKKPILVLGDPGQLPPVKGAGFFTKRKADGRLTEVHRQALDNPIIKFATDIRNGLAVKRQEVEHLSVYTDTNDDSLFNYDQILVGRNTTRTFINNKCRELKGLKTKIPMKGDKIICTRNNRMLGLYNGLIGIVTEDAKEDGDRTLITFDSDDGKHYKDIQVHTDCFENPERLKDLTYKELYEFNQFDYGYAITVHKAQGSQWEKVLVFDDGMLLWEKAQRRRWLYTAVTRAAEDLKVAKFRMPKKRK